jgi:hypothetical protein
MSCAVLLARSRACARIQPPHGKLPASTRCRCSALICRQQRVRASTSRYRQPSRKGHACRSTSPVQGCWPRSSEGDARLVRRCCGHERLETSGLPKNSLPFAQDGQPRGRNLPDLRDFYFGFWVAGHLVNQSSRSSAGKVRGSTPIFASAR